jgi:hypothetical protein
VSHAQAGPGNGYRTKRESTASGWVGRTRSRGTRPCWYRPLGPVRLVLRADLRLRWRAMLCLALLLGVIRATVLTAAAGARRTDTAYPRLLRWSSAASVLVVPNCVGLGGLYARLARLPQVASLWRRCV